MGGIPTQEAAAYMASRAAASEGGWQPIEGAPRDGSLCIVSPGGEGYEWAVATWARDHIGHGRPAVEGWWFDGLLITPAPAWWLPVPTPPRAPR